MSSPGGNGTAEDVVAAVDVGGTRIKASLVGRHYAEVVALTRPTPPSLDRPGELVDAVGATVATLLDSAVAQGHRVRVVGAGVVVPGLVDEVRGVAVYSTNLGWRDLVVSAPLAARLGVPVALGHDVRAGLVAEARVGAAVGSRHALFVPLGTGIAGAVMVDGHVLLADGWAGELGHVQVDPDGPPCACGGRGCLEAISSATAVATAYAALAGSGPGAIPLGADGVAALVAAGDPVATQVWDRAVGALARALVMATTFTGVDLVLVGGGLARSGPLLLEPLRRQVAAAQSFQRAVRIEPAALGDRAGCLGAACLAWDLP